MDGMRMSGRYDEAFMLHVLSLAVSGILVSNEHLGFLTLSFELPAIVRPSVHSRMSLCTTSVSHDMLTFSAGSQFAFLMVDSQEHHFTASASPRHSNLFPEPLVCGVCISSNFVTGAIRFQGPSYLFVSVKFKTFIFSVSVEIHLVSSESFGARVVHARSTSFQTLPFGLINVDSGTHQNSFVSFVISCFSVMYYDVHQIVEDPSGY
ncbi:hypothetical protein DY000_02010259 [Brassica cretica]|uniref:Uncharacterized protein n=1 Tax=Brassica cretica TaxID=69181 RepID=A0ABQ7C7V6_BRACR|nr:hypothetical protein DY000_02010259 [Brassica cretica]